MFYQVWTAAAAKWCVSLCSRLRAAVCGPSLSAVGSPADRVRRSAVAVREAYDKRAETREPPAHDLECVLVVVNKKKRAAQFRRRFARCAAPGEEIEHAISGVRVDAYDPLQQRKRFLCRVAGLRFAGGAHYRHPPDVGGRLAAGGFVMSGQSRDP